MAATIKQRVVVGADGSIVIRDTNLTPGTRVEGTIMYGARMTVRLWRISG
jgi:hypothetical protein